MPLIGRRRELTAVARLLDRARDGVGGVLVIAGPPGSGKTALADAAAALARARGLLVERAPAPGGLPVERASAAGGLPVEHTPTPDGRPVERTSAAGGLPVEHTPTPDGRPVERTSAAGGLPVERASAPGARLIVLDDADRGAWPDVSALTGGGAAVLLMTTGDAHRPDLRLAALIEPELAELLPGLSTDAVHAVWLASAGWPGKALDLAGSLDGLGERDAVVELALTTPSRSEFLILDVALIRLLESAATRPLPGATRARVIARLARELLGDPSAAARRRALGDEALALARYAGDPGTIAEVLDARLHALWDPAAAEERLATASEIVERAREAGSAQVERRGLFWRFVALAELGDLDAAEAALAAYARAGELDGDAEAGVVAIARQAMLAMIRGRFDLTEALTEEVVVAGHDAGLADTDRLALSLRGWLAVMRGDAGGEPAHLRKLARRLPGQFFEATAARTLAESGRDAEALLELDRLLPSVLNGSGPRWIGAVADLALVASHGGDPAAVQALYDALLPYRGRLVVWGGANMITGPVDDYLGRLSRRLGEAANEPTSSGTGGARHFAQAMDHFDRAVTQEERLGTLPWLAATLKVRGRGGDKERAAKLLDRLYPDKSGDGSASWVGSRRPGGPDSAEKADQIDGRPGSGAGPRDGGAAVPDGGAGARGDGAGARGDGAGARGDGAGARDGGAGARDGGAGARDGGAGARDGGAGARDGGADWRLERDGDDWRLVAGSESVRLNDVRGLHYLRTLLAAPGREIPALDLVAGGAGLRMPLGEPVLDATARATFRQRLDTLESQLDAADRRGDVRAAERLDAERTALVAELRRAGGLGGRPRRQSAEAERARVNATRALQTVLTRLEVAAPLAAAHLRASLHTGNRFRYQPAPGGPARWRV